MFKGLTLSSVDVILYVELLRRLKRSGRSLYAFKTLGFTRNLSSPHPVHERPLTAGFPPLTTSLSWSSDEPDRQDRKQIQNGRCLQHERILLSSR